MYVRCTSDTYQYIGGPACSLKDGSGAVWGETVDFPIQDTVEISSPRVTGIKPFLLKDLTRALPGENIPWKDLSFNKEEAKSLMKQAEDCCTVTHAPFLDEIDKDTPTPPHLEEKWAIAMYTGYGYEHIPYVLRYGKLREHVMNMTPRATIDSVLSLCRLVASGLNRLQEIKGFVYRGTGIIPDGFLKNYVPGNTIIEHSFLSGSKKKELVFTNDSLGVSRFTIKSKHARDASKFNKDFQEVIFLPETKFLITSRNKIDGILYIEMEEV